MRTSLSRFLRRPGRTSPSRPPGARLMPDPAELGVDFGLEATLAVRPAGAATSAAGDEPPLAWLGRPTACRPG